MSNTPSDAEILALAQQHLKAFAQFTGAGEVWFDGEVAFARAVLAKWGTQPQAGAVPQGWKAVPVNPTPEMWKAAKSVPDPNPPYPPHYGLVWDAMLAASPTPTAEQQAVPKAAPGVGNSGFDHQTAADFLSGKTVSDEAVRKFVAASRWAHDERAALSATLLAMHGVLTSREAEIALLKKALLEAEAAPQQEAQEPVAYVHVPHYPVEGKVRPVVSFEKYQQDYADGIYSTRIPLYAAPQPAPAPLSESEYKRGYRDGYERRDAEVRGALV